MLTTQTIWTIEPPRFGAFDLHQTCAEIVERYKRLPTEERAGIEIRVCTNGGLGFAVADKLRANGLPVTDFYRAKSSRASSAQAW